MLCDKFSNPNHEICRVSFIECDEIFTTYEKIKDCIPEQTISLVRLKEVNRIFDPIENAKYLKP